MVTPLASGGPGTHDLTRVFIGSLRYKNDD